MPPHCSSAADGVFGPQVQACRGSFDFTLFFEQSILGIAPSAILLFACFWRCLALRKEDIKVSSPTSKIRTSRALKQVTAVILASTQLALLILWSLSSSQRTKASIASTVLCLIADLAVFLLVSLEHTRSVRPSAVICIYLFFDTLLNIPQCRTLWLRKELGISVVFSAGLAIKLFMLWQESRGKRHILKAPYRFYPPEALGGLFSQITLWWLNPLFLKGFRTLLTLETLHNIDDELSAENIESKFKNTWKSKTQNPSKYSLLLATLSCFKLSLLWLAVPRLLLIGFKFAQPLLILRVTSFLDEPENMSKNFGYGLIGATGLIYLGLAVTTSLYKHQLNRVITMVRTSLVVAIYDKTISLNPFVINDSAALSLMSTDTETICNNMAFLDSLFMSPIEIALAIFLMAREVGVACLAPVVIAFGSTLLGLKVATRSGPLQKLWNQATQERVAFTASILSSPKGMKMLGLAGVLTKLLQGLRFDELERSKGARLFVMWRNFVANLSQILAPLFTFLILVYVRGSSTLNATEAFATLALIALITTPIQLLVNALSQSGVCLGCFERIQAYLMLHEDQPSVFKDNHASKIGLESSIQQPPQFFMRPEEQTPLQDLERGATETGDLILKMEGHTFIYPGSEHAVLHNIDICISPRSLTMIVGPVGCGKSTLLTAIVSFFSREPSFSQERRKSIAYCSQEPWLPNMTIEQIILASSGMEYGWYRSVLQACDLEKDLSTMPLSDQTVVGTGGMSLSGGQRQRLALARAIYARRSLILLDDVLSSLDAATGQIVFHNVLGARGLARRENSAVVLVSHNEAHLHLADNIIVLSKDGHMESQGSFGQLNSPRSKSNIVSKAISHDSIAGLGRPEQDQVRKCPEEASTPVQAVKFEDVSQDLSRKTGDLSTYTYYGKSLGYQNVLKYITVLSVQVFGTKFSDVWLQWWSGHRFNLGTGGYLGVYSSLSAIQAVALIVFPAYLLMSLVPKSSVRLHDQLLHATMNAPYGFFLQTDAGLVLTRFSQDISLVDKQLASAFLMFSYGVGVCIAEAILIALGQKYIAICLPPIIGVLYMLQKFYLRTSRQLRFLELESRSPLYTQFMETISGITTIQAFGWQQNSKIHCMRLLDRAQSPFYMLFCIQRWLNFVLDIVTAVLAIFVVAVAVSLPTTTSAGAIGLSMVNILNFGQSLAFLITTWTALETSLGAVARIKNFEETVTSEDVPNRIISPPHDWPQSGTLVLSHLSAAYDSHSGDVLRDINLNVGHREKVAIIGRSGSGKSSLVLTLFKMLNLTGGTIQLDGLDIASIPANVVREQLAAIPQESLMLQGTVRFNMDPLNTKSESEIIFALERAGLWEVLRVREGLDGSMDQVPLSAGQRQLFNLARVLLKKDVAKVLVLDEVASSVDTQTEERVMKIILEDFRNSTIIAVAHHLHSIIDFDRIVVMDAGRVVEVGKPQELLENKGSLFWDMWSRQ